MEGILLLLLILPAVWHIHNIHMLSMWLFLWQQNLVRSIYLLQTTTKNVGKFIKMNTIEMIPDFNLKNVFFKPTQAVKWPKTLRQFYQQIYGENVNGRALLLVCLWAVSKNLETVKVAVPKYNVDVLLSPKRTLKYIWKCKIYVKWIEDNVDVYLHESGIRVHDCIRFHWFVRKVAGCRVIHCKKLGYSK